MKGHMQNPIASIETNYSPREFKLIALRECPTPEKMIHVTSPGVAVAYWRAHIASTINLDVENLVVIALNGRRRIRGHQIVGIGSDCEVSVCVREVFRAAVVLGAASIIVAHNHPSGIAESSEEDRKQCRLFDDAGDVLGIEHLDSIIIGNGQFASLKGFGDSTAGKTLLEADANETSPNTATPFSELPKDDAPKAEWLGWNKIVDFESMPHPDLWLGPDDRFYLAGSSSRLLPITVKEGIGYIEFALDCASEPKVIMTRFLSVAGDAIPGPRADYRDLIKREALLLEEPEATL